MTTTSSIQDAIAGLVGLFSAMPEADAYDLSVYDGYPMTGNRPNNFMVVCGIDAVGQPLPITGQQTDEGTGYQLPPRWETYNLPVTIYTHVGGTDQTEPRATAMSIFNSAMNALLMNYGLGGAINNRAAISTFDMTQTQLGESAQGRFINLTFYVACRHLIQFQP